MYLKRELKISTIVHIGILIAIIIYPIISPPKYRYNRPTVHTVQLINLPAIKPQQTPSVTKPKVSEPVKKIVPPPKAQPKQSTKPLTTPTLEEKLSKRLEEIQKEEPAKLPTTESGWEEPSPTHQFTTSVSSPADFPFQWYLALIHDKISTSWHEPQMVLDKKYSAIITFIISKDGGIQNIHIKKSSGISNFDQSGLKAIELAKPFPQLPPGYPYAQLTVNAAFNLE